MSDIQVTITDNNASIGVNFAQSIATNLAVHNTDETAHDNIISKLKATDSALIAQVATKAETSNVPTKTSDLQNDSSFVTVSQIPSVPTNVSQLVNDSNYANTTQLNTKANKNLDNLTQPTALTNLGFTGYLFNANGYYKFPNGLIIQWGTYSLTSSSLTTLNFPIAFTTNCLSLSANVKEDGTTWAAGHSIYAAPTSTSTFAARRDTPITGTCYFYLIAIGY